jgi:hypothetical protein
MERGLLFRRSNGNSNDTRSCTALNDPSCPIGGHENRMTMTPSRHRLTVHCGAFWNDERLQLLRIFILACLIAFFLHRVEFGSFNNTEKERFVVVEKSITKKTLSISDAAEKYEHQCATSTTITQVQQVSNNTAPTKPFWVPSYPNSDMGIFKDLVIRLTGESTAAKSYYAQSKAFKKCFGNTRTFTCEMIHPIVSIGPPPEQQASKFQNQIILPIRNPITLFPAHHQSKAEQYHGATTQVNISEWRAVRDQYYQSSLVEWKILIQTWKSMPGYDGGIVLYVVYEHFFRADTGPAQVQALGRVLQSAGFPLAAVGEDPSTNNNKDNLQHHFYECTWYATMRHRKSYAHDTYRPSFRREQMQIVIQFLRDMQTEFQNDTQLVQILQEYIEEANQLPPDTV